MFIQLRLFVSSGVGTALMWIILPWLVSKILQRLRKRERKRPERTFGRGDYLVSLLLFLGCLFMAWKVYTPPYDFMKVLGIDAEMPSYLVRNYFRDYMVDRFPGWTEGSSLSLFDDDEKAKIIRLEAVYDQLKGKEERKLYLKVGHDAFVQCGWCHETSDFLFWNTPSILSTYLFAFTVLGIASVTRRKAFWRLYGSIYLCFLVWVDIYLLALSENSEDLMKELFEDRKDVPGGLDGMSGFETAYKIRHAGILLLFFAVLIVSSKQHWRDVDILQEVLMMQQANYSRSQTQRLAMSAVLGTTNLRRKFMDYYKEREAEKNAVYRDLEFKEMRARALQMYNVNAMVDSAMKLSEEIMMQAQMAGVVKEVAQSDKGAQLSVLEDEEDGEQEEDKEKEEEVTRDEETDKSSRISERNTV